MKRASRFYLCLALSLSTALPLVAQTVADVNDRLYTDLSLWQERGLIARLPPFRPYPIQLVKSLLAQVKERGEAADQARAKHYLSAIDGSFNGHLAVGGELRSNLSQSYEQISAEALMQGALSPLFSYSASLGGAAVNGETGALPPFYQPSTLPYYQRPTQDYLNDAAVASVGATGFTPKLSMTGQAAIGSESLYFQAGIFRDSFGPVWGDSAVLSPYAPQAADYSFTWEQGFFTYTALLKEISATHNDGGGGLGPNKYLALHSIEFYPLPWLTVGLFESQVWGNRFDPAYLLPLPAILYYADGLYGFPDNSFIGLSAGVKLPAAIKADGLLYVDDASFNDLIKLHFNTMLVLSFQGGLSWTPNLPFLTRLSVNNLLVTPYTYTHNADYTSNGSTSSPSAINYENYTNAGQNMGPSLQPNSDRIELSALIRPIEQMDLTLFGRYILHGNASYGLPNMPAGSNGTLFDPGYDNGGSPTFAPGAYPSDWVYTRFLTQPVLEQTLQAGFDALLTFETPIGEITGELSYTYEHIANPIDNNGNPQQGLSQSNNYVSVAVGIKL